MVLISFTLGGICSLDNSQDRVGGQERRTVEGKEHKQIDFLLENAKQLAEVPEKHALVVFMPELGKPSESRHLACSLHCTVGKTKYLGGRVLG